MPVLGGSLQSLPVVLARFNEIIKCTPCLAQDSVHRRLLGNRTICDKVKTMSSCAPAVGKASHAAPLSPQVTQVSKPQPMPAEVTQALPLVTPTSSLVSPAG